MSASRFIAAAGTAIAMGASAGAYAVQVIFDGGPGQDLTFAVVFVGIVAALACGAFGG